MSLPSPHLTVPPSELVARIRAGDVSAFEALFRAEYAALATFASRYVGERSLAEELVQDLFTDLWTRRASWDVRGAVRPYLFAAVRNRALNVRKRLAAERDWLRREAVSEVRTLHAEPEAPDHRLDADETRTRVRAALEALPERCRLVMRLRWHDRLSHADIAGIMGISVKGVENQLARGLERLRGLLT